MSAMRMPASPFVRDCWWAAALTVTTQAELVLASDLEHPALQHLVFIPMTGAIAFRRRAPLVAAAAVGIAMSLQTFAGDAPVVGGFLAMLIVLLSLGFHAPWRAGVLGVALVSGGALTYDVVRADFNLADFVGNAAIVVGAWALALAVRRSTDARVAAELARDAAAREAVQTERDRIARDLHDSVAHALTLMTLQAGAARERATQPAAVEALSAIESGGRQALLDMHRFLRLLPEDGSEARTLQDLDDLVEQLRAGGFEAHLLKKGDLDTLPTSISATAYRTVQEGLTNAAKHSGAGAAHVTIRRDEDELRVEITDTSGTHGPLSVGSGRGLAGLRDRLEVFEGSLTAGPGGSGWVLRAVIPIKVSA